MEDVLLVEIEHGGGQLLSMAQHLPLRHLIAAAAVQDVQQTLGNVLLLGEEGGEGGRGGEGEYQYVYHTQHSIN